MTNTDKSYAQIKEMSSEDKRVYILRLTSRLDNAEYKASALLRSEIEHFGLSDNLELASCMAKLQVMEQRLNKLNKEYEVEYHNTIIPLARGFIQEQEQMKRNHKQRQLQFSQHRAPVLLAEQIYANQQRELEQLKERQTEQKQAIIKQMSAKLNDCKHDIRVAFADAIGRIYR